jgi:hypothetical protein
MAECECLKGCPFFNDKMKMDEGMGLIYKKKYCLGDNSDCARYMIFKALGPGIATNDIFPNNKDKALKLIAEKNN